MGFLIRIALLLGLVILFIPADESETKKSGAEHSVSLFDTIGFATAAYSDASGFCGRNPQACSTGGVILDTFEAKARTGARWVYAWLEPGHAAAPAPAASAAATADASDVAPTSRAGLVPALRGPVTTGSVRRAASESNTASNGTQDETLGETMVTISPRPRGEHPLPPPPPPRPLRVTAS